MLKIFNVRFGFANNSSSTHSIIFLNKPAENIADDYDNQFGFEYFTVASKSGVLDYLNSTLRGNFGYSFNKDYIEAIVTTWTHKTPKSNGCVDHQSNIMFPLTYNRSGIDKRYFDQIKEVLLNNNTIILGGNNDDNKTHPLKKQALIDGVEAKFHTLDNPGFVCKYDNKYNYWTLFNIDTGTKLRLIINNTGESVIIPQKSSYPDLVDMKITDFCSFGCKYCYQGSTSKGNHAELYEIRWIIDELSRREVFEIAFGGGEPTSHPNFIEILEYANRNHIVPNFTTRNLNWLYHNYEKIRNTIGSLAFSVDDSSQVENVAALAHLNNIEYGKLCIQYVLESNSEYNLEKIIEACYKGILPLTLLGFKRISRGGNYHRSDNSNWLKIIEKCRENNMIINIGVDTAIVQQYADQLKDFPHWMYHKHEGAFSWYIDCVTQTMGASSYHETTSYENMYNFSKHFNSAYADYNCSNETS